MDLEQAFCIDYKPTRLERVARRLFPRRFVEERPKLRPRHAIHDYVTPHDFIMTRVEVGLSFVDRLRLLVSGRLRVEIEIHTENIVGETASASAAWPEAPKWMLPEE